MPIVNVLTDRATETLIHVFPVNAMISTVVTAVLASTMMNHSAADVRKDTKTGKIEPICLVVSSTFKIVNSNVPNFQFMIRFLSLLNWLLLAVQ